MPLWAPTEPGVACPPLLWPQANRVREVSIGISRSSFLRATSRRNTREPALDVFAMNKLSESRVIQRARRKASVRILIADDHPMVRQGLRILLSLEDDFDVVGEAADGCEVLDQVRKLDPDVLLLDLWMPHLGGLSTLEALAQLKKHTKVFVLTAAEDCGAFEQAIKLGCSAIVRKQTAPQLIIKSIRKVLNGEILPDSRGNSPNMASPDKFGRDAVSGPHGEDSPLSAREREIVRLVAQGYKNREMAKKMLISEQTVKNHLHNIFDKLGISDRLELTFYSIYNGIHLNGDPPVPR
jgi:DNA-binding NarL/FixJ family response regulator